MGWIDLFVGIVDGDYGYVVLVVLGDYCYFGWDVVDGVDDVIEMVFF